jgi:hypothetical protein
MSQKSSPQSLLLPIGGAITGTTAYATVGGIGLVGSFGGIGLGIGAMTGVGAIAGGAIYGGLHAIETGDQTGYLALGLGTIGGASLYSTIGGVGLGVGGTAFGLGMGAMAVSGGVVGLGIYGLAKMFNDTSSKECFTETYTRIEEKISDQEAYNQAMMELDPKLAEFAWEQKWGDIEVEDELNQLKEKLKDKIDYQVLTKNRKLEQERKSLMVKLKHTCSSSKRLYLLKQIDKIEEQIKIKKWKNTHLEDELTQLEEKLKDKIDYQALRENRKAQAISQNLKQKRSILMEQLENSYSSRRKFDLLKEIDQLESEINLIKNKYNL